MTDVRITKKNELYIIVECDPELKYILNDYYSFEVQGHKFMPAYKSGSWDGRIRLFSVTSGQIYYGLLNHLTKFLKDNNYTYEISSDVNEKCNYDVDTYIKSLKLPFAPRDYQIDTVKECIYNNRKLILSPTSSGKCKAKDTPVLMYDGLIKMVQDVVVGDLIMGDDSTPRKVLSTCSGEETMYRITPKKGDSWVCNESHILSLVSNSNDVSVNGKKILKDQIVDVSILDYLAINKTSKHCLKQYRAKVDSFGDENNDVLEPWMFGLWLGDGSKKDCTMFHLNDSNKSEISYKLTEILTNFGYICKSRKDSRTHGVDLIGKNVHQKTLSKIINDIYFKENQFISTPLLYIPHIFKTSSFNNRLRLIAGLLDSDGYTSTGVAEFSCKSEQLAEDICFLCRSVGIAAYKVARTTYADNKPFDSFRVNISGDLSIIPCIRLPLYKIQHKSNVLRTGITITKLPVDKYYGFELDGNHRYLLGDFTVTHNTISLYMLANYYKDFCKVLIIFPNTSLVIQTKKEFISYGMDAGLIHEIFEDHNKQSDKPIVMSTWQGIYTQPKSYFKQYGCVQVDECFTPDTEILTNKGFVRFDCLDKSELVAQYDADINEISFIKPIKYIENDYSGKLINAYSNRGISITTTPNHEILLYNKKNHYIKKNHKDVSYIDRWTIKTCGLTSSGIKTELTQLDKLLIAYQADGSLHHINANGSVSISFTFSKQRKIDKFLDIMGKGSFNFKEVKGKEPHNNIKAKRRFLVYGVPYAYKDISKHFNIEELSVDACKQIIEEMVCWDGSITKTGLYYYSSTIKSNVDFYQAVAVLCNYHSNQTVQIDNRSDTFSDVYRLFIRKNKDKISCSGITKSEIDYNGKVYCVKVPTGNIVVRHNGKVVITGNCHTAVAKSLTTILQHLDQCKYRFGFTGTLDGAKANKLQLMGLFGDCKQVVTTKELIENKQISDVLIKIIILKHPYRMFDTYTDELEYLVTHKIRNNFIKNLVAKLKGNTLVLFSRVEQQGLPLYEQFTKELTEKNTHLVYGKIDSDEREKIRQLVETEQNGVILASYQTYQQGINIKNLHNVIFASPSKSRIRNLQSIGRGLRLHDSKERATIYDIADNISLGNIKNYTIDHLMDRIKYYSEEELNFNITEIELFKKKL